MTKREAFGFGLLAFLSVMAWVGGDVRGAQLHATGATVILALARGRAR